VRYRRVPRLDWEISEIGYGMWGMGGWTGSDYAQSAEALDLAVSLGCNFFDTAFAYGDGRSERLLGALLARHPGRRLYTATKVPPKDRIWPGKRSTPAEQVFPYEHVLEYTEKSRTNMGVDAIDLQQLHVWDDSWTSDDGWKRAAERLKNSGHVRAFGISVNRWQPENVIAAIETGLVDFVQVVYNIFDQNPEDVLFPACERHRVAVIARVPFDEGSLTGTLNAQSSWPAGDFRNSYFAPPRLAETLSRLGPLHALTEQWQMPMPAAALAFILAEPRVTTVIPGMRKRANVESNLAVSDRGALDATQVAALRPFRWDRVPDERP
jgi:aryl-alcohol dehydrogenase-like predicted oxidoreductase